MIGLDVLFWLFVVLFGMIGFLRGWAKELMVTVSIVLAIFIISVLEHFVPFIRDVLVANPGPAIFWLRAGMLIVLMFFGYQTPNISRLATNNRFAREKLQDILLGALLGAINGFMFWGSILYYIININYQFPLITAPVEGSASFAALQHLIPLLPPSWLGIPTVYFAAALVFAFVIVVMI
jgi:uncharacterized membrane protein required for colicin V production